MDQLDPQRLVVRKAPLPYYMPYVIVCRDTHRIVGHFRTEAAAKQELREYQAGTKIPAISAIQQAKDPMKAQEARMQNPFGEPRPVQPIITPGVQKKRTIRL